MSYIRVGQRLIGAGRRVYLVAEIGINHNGDMELAEQTIRAAAGAGADAVKFQNYRTEDFVRDPDLKYTYAQNGREICESQMALFKRCELSASQLRRLKGCCDTCGVGFHSTPTSPQGIRDLLEVGVEVLKNGSDCLTHVPLLRALGATGLPVVLSTGMATLDEIAEAVGTVRGAGAGGMILLHCTSAYPTPPSDVHLRKIPTLARAFGCPVGFSDHSSGMDAALGAVALGACWIEKHFTLDRTLPGPDHAFSSDPQEFRQLVEGVRTLELQLGDARIGPSPAERPGRNGFRLSCAAAHDLPAGRLLTLDDLSFARPGTGLPPALAHLLVGRPLRRDRKAGVPLGMEDVA